MLRNHRYNPWVSPFINFKSFLCITVSFILIISMVLSVSADEIDNKSDQDQDLPLSLQERQISEVLEGFQAQSSKSNSNSTDNNITKNTNNISKLQRDAVKVLINHGFEAYGIDENNIHDIEKSLETNLTEIGIYPSGHYIVVVSSDSSPNGTSSLRKTKAGSSFEYTYNGKKYKLRFLTVTSSDVSSYAKASDCNILSSKVKSTIQKCLDTAIIAYISSFSKTLGTVASITGLSISNFGTAKTSTLRLNGASNWTRVYTQVWDASHKTWVSGSCVEYVQVLSYMSGSYYNKDKNRMEKVSQAEKRYKKYSGKYNDKTWRKKNAIAGYIHSIVNYNMTGDVAFYYGKSKKFTHKENF